MRDSELREAGLKSWRDGDAAIDHLRRAAERSPASPAPWLDLAECLWAVYDFDESLRAYTTAAEIARTDPAPCLQAAKKLFGLGRFEESARWLERAVALAPGAVEIRVMLGEVCERCGRLDAAEQHAREVLNRNPASAKAVRLLAHLERRRGGLDQARLLLERQLQRHPGPEDWQLQCELAVVLDRLGQYEDAFQILLLAKDRLRPLAGQFVEPANALRRRQREIADALTSDDFRLWQEPGCSSPVPMAILCGHPRSGTTLLEQILAAHPGIVSTDETGVWQREFLEPILRDAPSALASVEELRGFTPDQIEAGRQTYLHFTRAHLGQPIANRLLVEKDPSLTPDLPLPLRLFPEAKVVFPIRDPRDVCISYFFTILPLNRASAHALTLESAAEFCAHSFRFWQRWREIVPTPLLETRYESLVADPSGEARRLIAFLGLDWDERVLKYHENRRGVRTPTYADVAQPIYTRSVGRWKNYARYLEPCRRVLEPVLAAFGYD